MPKLLLTTVACFLFLGLELQVAFSQPEVIRPRSHDTIKDIMSFRALGNVAVDRHVDLTATITFCEPIWNYLFVQDGDLACFVAGVDARGFTPGDRVRITGKGCLGDLEAYINADQVSKIAPGKLPNPKSVKISELNFGDHDCIYVSAEGVVVQAVSSMGHTLYHCEDNGHAFQVSHFGSKSLDELWDQIGSKMRFVGALGISVEEGTEGKDWMIGERGIELFLLASPNEPEIISSRNNGAFPAHHSSNQSPHSFLLEGQITSTFEDFFVLDGVNSPKRIFYADGSGISHSMIARVAGKRIKNAEDQTEFHALAIESLFSTRFPTPIDLFSVETNNRNWEFVKVVGKPVNIRLKGQRICFEINQAGKNANIELSNHVSTSLDIIKNLQLLEVHGILSNSNEDGSCTVTVNSPKNFFPLEAVVPIWKYLAWFLLPISTLFLIGFISVKTQRNSAASQNTAIKAIHARLISTHQAISDGLLAIDSNNRVLSVNNQFCKMIGCEFKIGETFTANTSEEFLGRVKNHDNLGEFIFSHDLLDAENRNVDLEIIAPEPAVYDLSVSSIVADDGDYVGRLLILRDKTRERQLQSELIHANKLEAVGQLVGGIAHDFNNILTTIMANLSLVSMDSQIDSKASERLADAEVATSRGTDLVRRLLTYSGKAELNPLPHSINTIIQELHKFAKATFDSRYQFVFDLDDSEPYVLVDSGSIEQVVLNLYLNARDAMPDGGKITTRTRLITQDNNSFVSIWIIDSGPGVSEAIRAKIFDPFFTTKAGQAGTGLGLSTSRRLILEQNGTLEYAPASDPGSSFEIQLPITKSVNNPAVEVHEPRAMAESKTVLVVDDEDSVRKICTSILELHDFSVLTAVNGEAALAVLQTEHERIDLMLLDLTMPGMSGLDVLEIVVVEYPNIPIVLCSGYLAGISNDLGNNCLKLPKPFSAKQLIAAINNGILEHKTSNAKQM